MPHTVISPLSRQPLTREFRTPDGHPAYRVTPHVLTPWRARIADACTTFFKVVLAFACVITFFMLDTAGLIQAGLLVALYFAGGAGIRWVMRYAFRRRAEIVMTTEKIGVRRWFFWKWFPRQIEHRFSLQVHDAAQQEQRDLEFAVRKAASNGKVLRVTPYYADSFHVVLVLAGHREDLMTVYGAKDAAAVVARLQYLDRCLDAVIAMGAGVPRQPEDEWHEVPGSLRIE